MPRGRAAGDATRKPDAQRVNRGGARNAAKARTVTGIHSSKQPDLGYRPGPEDWPEETMDWWEMWGRSPLVREWTENDWQALRDTAVYHALLWSDETPHTVRLKAGTELRQREANFGATPLDRQRLRIQFVMADEAEEKQEESRERRKTQKSSRGRRGPLIDEEEEEAG